MKVIYMNDTVILIQEINGIDERNLLISKGKVIERENEEPYLIIDDTEEEEQKE